jgi:hypothetical protein
VSEKLPIEYRKIKPTFKLVFIMVCVLVIIFFTASLILALQPQLSDAGKSVLDTASTLTKIGFGAICGLLGGKVVP